MLRAGLWHRGRSLLVGVDNPPVGLNWVTRVPDSPEGVWWKIKSIQFRYTASAVAGNRSPRVWFGAAVPDLAVIGFPPDAAYMIATSAQVVAVATTGFYSFFEGAVSVTASAPLPADLRLPSGHYIGSFTGGMDPGDQYANIRLFIEEWIYEPPGERTSNIGDVSDASRVDTIKLTKAMERIAELLEAQQATP